jgi:hypothetical protein
VNSAGSRLTCAWRTTSLASERWPAGCRAHAPRGGAASFQAGWHAAVDQLRPQLGEWQIPWRQASAEIARLRGETGNPDER